MEVIKNLSVVLFGSHAYKNDYANYGNRNSLQELTANFSQIFGPSNFSDFSDNNFSKPSAFFESLKQQLNTSELVILYFYGHIMQRRDNRIYFSYKFSNPKKSNTHIPIEDIFKVAHEHPEKKLILIIDSDFALHFNDVRPILPDNCLIICKKFNRTLNVPNESLFSVIVVKTLFNLAKYIPQFDMEGLLKIVSAKLAVSSEHETFLKIGSYKLLSAKIGIPNIIDKSIWSKDEHNFNNLNKGSREDGIQNLYESRLENHDIAGAHFIAEYFSLTDVEENVRKAAKRYLTDINLTRFDNYSYVINEDIKSISIDWCAIPSGSFNMGSSLADDEFSLPEEMPKHTLFLENFQISKFPITNALFNLYRNAFDIYEPSEALDLPATNVSWYDAVEFCKWLTFQMRKQLIIRHDEIIMLPSEAQWEKAARGTDGRIYPWGNTFDGSCCNYRDSGNDKVIAVGQFSPKGDSPYGVSDMAGNIWEWTLSAWGKSGRVPEYTYPYNKSDGRENIDLGDDHRRVVRGGSYYYFDYCVRAATRNIMYPFTKHSGGGFRIVKINTKVFNS